MTSAWDLMNMVFFEHTKPNEALPPVSWGETFNGVRRALRGLQTPRDIVSYYVKEAKINPVFIKFIDLPCNIVVPKLSRLKMLIHERIDTLTDRWQNYLDLANLAGYPKMVDRETVDDAKLWLSSPVESQYNASWWQAQFEETCSLGRGFEPPVGLLSYRDFVLARWLWATDGASSASRAELDGVRVKTKFGAALSLTDAELLSASELDAVPRIGIFLKPDEPGYKRRLIANVDLGGYLAAAYVRYLLEGCFPSPVWKKLDTSFIDTLDVVALLRLGKLMVPLDESAYDYHVSRESWLGFFSFLNNIFPNNYGVSKLFSFYERAMWSWDGAEGKWVSGMPSGLALTSLLNSWMNFIKQRHVLPGLLQWAAGDDTLVSPFTPKPLTQVEREYAEFGSVVNSTKNWESHKYAEYLKRLYTRSGTTGYPARVYSSLIWASKVVTFLPGERLSELAELWKQWYDRLGVPMDEVKVAADLSRAVSNKVSGFNSVTAREWLHSARINGGFGLLPYNNKVFDWKVDVLRRKGWSQVMLRMPEINFYSDEVVLVVKEQNVRRNVTTHIGPPLRLKPVETINDWEARLNGEDNPVRGKYRTLALGTVPLPVVNGVSTATMSDFAKAWGYNVFPNLVGSQDSINSRLLLLSEDLALNVMGWMKKNAIRQLV